MKKLVGVIGIAVLFSLFGTMAPASAQDQQHQDQAKPEQHAKQREHAQQKEERQSKSSQHAQKQERAQQAKPTRQTERASNNRRGHIPDDRFRAHFGRDHRFRINRPVMVGGAPRFQYGGYWFGFAQPWPVGWYYTDPVYIDYVNGGYYLLSPVHPGVQISINVVL
ncbi:MAG TPA: hypothetical protein VMX16_08515 [Terriglobia bacterium]|nr:hypothetical protein [Terriglobia bacterium]